MKFKSFAAAAGAVLLATAGAAQAGEARTATGVGVAAGFSALTEVTAVPMSIEELAAVQGRVTVADVIEIYPPDPISPSPVAGAILVGIDLPEAFPARRE